MALTQSKSWSRLAQFALRTIIFFSIAFATLWTVLSFWPGLAILPFVGRAKISPFCSTWQAVRDAAVKVRQGELEKEIRANTRLIRTEKGYKLWSTPKGEFWVPDTSDEIIEILLAQQKRKIYGDAESGGARAGDIVLDGGDRKSTRLNSSHRRISYAVFCLKKRILVHHHGQSSLAQMEASLLVVPALCA